MLQPKDTHIYIYIEYINFREKTCWNDIYNSWNCYDITKLIWNMVW